MKDANGNAVSGATVSAVVTGPGLINGIASSDGTGNAGTLNQRVVSLTTTAGGWVVVGLAADGSAGVSTVTLTSGTASVSRSVTFSGTSATLTPTLGVGTFAVGTNGLNAAGGSAEDSSTAYAIKVKVLDSAGGLAQSGSIYAVSSNKAVATVSSAAHAISKGYVYILVTGVAAGTANITFQNTDPTGTTAPTATATQAIEVTSSTADKVVVATDKASYQAGEPGTLSITLTNAAGRPVADGTYTIFAATTPLVSNLYLQGNSTGPNASAWSTGMVSVTTFGGVASYDFYAPSVSGTLTFTGTTLASSTSSAALSQNVRGSVLTTSASVGSSASGGDASLALDAANAATDAANNAYDEAQNATQAASDALAAVKALAVQVKALIALVTKIKNKVGA